VDDEGLILQLFVLLLSPHS